MNKVTVSFLEMSDRAVFVPSEQRPRFTLSQVTAPAATFLRYLYEATGAEWHWIDRIPWTEGKWLERQYEPGVEFWVGWEGGAPLGYFELARQPDDSVELVYFGLLPHAVGIGQGGAFLSAAIARAWEMGATRVSVNTCTLDHPSALSNYEKRGFRLVRTEERSPAPT